MPGNIKFQFQKSHGAFKCSYNRDKQNNILIKSRAVVLFTNYDKRDV